MSDNFRDTYWDSIHESKGHDVSWWQTADQLWMDVVESTGLTHGGVVDVGAGQSEFLIAMHTRGFQPLYANDISASALSELKKQAATEGVTLFAFAGDVTALELPETVELWHDRAVFHFFVEEENQLAYKAALSRNTHIGSFAIISTFSPRGPETCSGLPVQRWSADELVAFFGTSWELTNSTVREHHTPWDSAQEFTTVVLQRIN